MKTLKSILAVGFFIAMFLYVQSEEKKVKYNTQPNHGIASKNDTTNMMRNNSTISYVNTSIAIKN